MKKNFLLFFVLALFCFGIVTKQASAALTLLGTGSAIASTSANTTAAINTTGASLIVIQASRFTAIPVAPTDSQGNTWTPLSVHNDGGGSEETQYYYVCAPSTASTQTFSVGGVGITTPETILVAAYSGTATSNCYDTGTDKGGKTTSGTTALPSITPSQSGDLVVSGVAENTGSNDTFISVNQGLTVVASTTVAPTRLAWTQYNSTSP
jgi:hypothetical protein